MAPSSRQRASQVAAASYGGRSGSEKIKKQQQQQKKRLQPLIGPDVAHDQMPRITLNLELQQSILNVFRQAFPVIARPSDFKNIMQEVKGHLYQRDFQSAFSKQEYLDVYASRWSAARALAYTEIFTAPDRHVWFRTPASVISRDRVGHLSQQVQDLAVGKDTSDTPIAVNMCTAVEQDGSLITRPSPSALLDREVNLDAHALTTIGACGPTKVMCIGGGAGAEIVALAASNRYLRNAYDNTGSQSAIPLSPQMDILAVDIADWSSLVQKLSAALTAVPDLSEYTPQSARDADRPLFDSGEDGNVSIAFKQQDVLQIKSDALKEIVLDVALVTIMFTLNELFSTSLPKTTTLLLNLTDNMMIGSHLLVVDSPGSYSEIKLGKSKQPDETQDTKRYPMKWLLDHTLLEISGKDKAARWVKIEDEDSKWFRIHEKQALQYDVDLENCRYQLHVYRKVR